MRYNSHENSIKRSASNEKLVYQHGERLFIFDDGKYKIAAVQLAWEIFKEKQNEVDELQAAFKQLIEMENESISFEHDLFDKGWNQSARQTIENIYKLAGLGEQALKGD